MIKPSTLIKAKDWFLQQTAGEPVEFHKMPQHVRKCCYDLDREGFLIRDEYIKEFPGTEFKRRKMVRYYVDSTALPATGT